MARSISKQISLPAQNWHFVKDEKLCEMLERDYAELKRLITAGANKSILVMCGSILEASIISVLQENNPGEDYTAHQWGLGKLIEATEKPGLLAATERRQASFLTDYRNLIHPGREHREKIDLDDDTVVAVVALFKRVIRSLAPLPQDKSSFIMELGRSRSEEEARFADKVLKWAEENSVQVIWGKGKIMTCNLKIEHNDLFYSLIKLSTDGRAQMKFGNLKHKRPFNQRTKRVELRNRLNSIPGVNLSEGDINRFPTISMSAILDEHSTQKFLETLEWTVNRIKL